MCAFGSVGARRVRFCDVTTADACGVVRARSSLCCVACTWSRVHPIGGHPEPRNRSYNSVVRGRVTVPVRERECRRVCGGICISHDVLRTSTWDQVADPPRASTKNSRMPETGKPNRAILSESRIPSFDRHVDGNYPPAIYTGRVSAPPARRGRPGPGLPGTGGGCRHYSRAPPHA